MDKTEALIIGAGMAGLTQAALLAQQGIRVTVIDRTDPGAMASEAFDSRTVALSLGSKNILAPLGIWDKMAAHGTAITSIDVQEGHDPFILNFEASDAQAEAFGWILPNSVVRKTLYDTAKKHKVTFVTGVALKEIVTDDDTVTARLDNGREIKGQILLGIDGRASRVRALLGVDTVDLDYKQTALVGLITHEHPHRGLALERFYPDGPFAVLPFTDDTHGRHRSAVVWTQDNKNRLQKIDLSEITALMQPFFDARYGVVEAIGTWAAYPLNLTHAKSFIAPRVALLSDAAHAIHPIAGQGLNLGMRDVACITALLSEAKAEKQDLGSDEILNRYQRARRFDVFTMVAATDLLNRLFGNKLRLLRRTRSVGLGIVQKIPALKRFFMGVAMGQAK